MIWVHSPLIRLVLGIDEIPYNDQAWCHAVHCFQTLSPLIPNNENNQCCAFKTMITKIACWDMSSKN